MAANVSVIAVVGATGAQGGAVVQALLKSYPQFKVRALTRKTNSDKAVALANQGVEVVEADLDNKESLVRAFTGCAGAFLLTNYWEIFDVNREIQQGKNQVDACKEAGVAHVVFSTLEGVKKVGGDKFKLIGEWAVPHFDGKDVITDYLVASGLNYSLLYTCFYYENWCTMSAPHKGQDGNYYLSYNMGETPMPAVAVTDIGTTAARAFGAGAAVYGKKVYAVGENIPISEYAKIFSKVFGKTFIYAPVTTEQFAAFGFPGADDLANMFQFYRDFVPDFPRDVAAAKEFNPELIGFEQWLTANKARFNL